MKKFFTYFFALAALFSVAVSCNDEDDYKPAEPVSGPQVFFSPDLASTIELSEDATSFEVGLLRADTSESISLPLTVSGETDKFDIPTLVSFAAGAESATLTIGYDPEDFEYDVYYDATLVIPEEYSTPYGLAEYTFSAVKSAPWISLGMCTYTDDIFTTFWSVGNLSWEVEIEENEMYPGQFRLVYPYDEKYEWNDPGDWDESQTYYMTIDAQDPDGVYIEQQEIGVDWGYGMISIMSLGWYYYAGGNTWEAIKNAGYCGTYKDGVITFPEDGMLMNMPGYSSSWYYSNTSGAFKVVMPGAVVADYSIEVDYVGKYTDPDDANYAIGEVTFVGEDVAYAHVALFEGKDGDAAVAAIKANEVDCQEITESGNVLFSCDETGTYTIAVVSYSDAGEAQDSDYVTFKFEVGAGETWSLYGTGDYEYSKCYSGTDPGLELYQSDSDPTRFKIEHWCYDVDFYFTWDQDTNEVLVDDQVTGDTYYSYGDILIDDMYDYYGLGTSTYNNGIFYFAVIYYCSAGYFGRGYETFTLEGASFTPSVAAVEGQYYVGEISYYGSYYNDVNVWKLTASDDSTKGNIMMTAFDGFNADAGCYIYGNLDTSTGVFSIPDWQYYRNYSNVYDLYFASYTGADVEFQLVGEGVFEGPVNARGEYFGLYLCDHSVGDEDDDDYYLGWNNLYTVAFGSTDDGKRYSSASGSVKMSTDSAKKLAPVSTERGKAVKDDALKVANTNVKKAASTTSYNFVPTVEVKACPKNLDKTQVKDNLQRGTSLK